jgi:dihydrofolate reductase
MNTEAGVPIALVVALSRNGVIGADNALPWHLPGDLKHFKSVTLGKPVVMGRRTFESIGRPLPGRHNIVVTRNRGFAPSNGVAVAHSLDDALAQAQHSARLSGSAEVVVIGGAEIYRQALPLAELVYLTRVDLMVEGDAFFADLAPDEWLCEHSEERSDEGIRYRLERWRRHCG